MNNNTSVKQTSYLLVTALLITLFTLQPAFSQVNIAGSWATGTSHTKVTATNRALIFFAYAERAGTMDLTGVTYGGQAMTKVLERSAGTSTYAYVAAYILNEAGVAAATSGTFVPTWNVTPTELGYSHVFLENVNQAALLGATSSNAVTSGNTITAASLANSLGDMVIDAAVCGNSGDYTINNGFIKGIENDMSSSTGAAGYKSATGTAETPSATHSGANRQAIIGFVVQGTPADPNTATNPNPVNGAVNISVSTNLSWNAPAGFTPTSYDIYLGTDSNAHNNPKYTVGTNGFDPSSDLSLRTKYYWAVDSNDNGTIHSGIDWNFKTVGTAADRVADYIVSVPLTDYYATICAYYGVMMYSEVIGDQDLQDAVINAYQPYYNGTLTPPEGNVDKNVFGILPFELHRQTGDANYLTLAVWLADREFANPRSDGLSAYTRFWIDDTYMIGSLQAQAHKSTLDPNYANRAVTQLLGYMGVVNQLQQSNGLFHHTLNAPYFWGRGNGWAAAAMTEVLSTIPLDHSGRASLMEKYQNMMAGLVAVQGASGMWYQVLNMPTDSRNWYESSCTGMFVFAMATGVKNGWLPEVPYKQAALNGWAALETYVNASGQVTEVCTGTGEGTNVDFYFNRPREVGNTHGQSGVIWAAKAIELLNEETYNIADFDTDGDVDLVDLAILTDNWLSNDPSADIFPAEGDGIVDFLDYAVFANNWL